MRIPLVGFCVVLGLFAGGARAATPPAATDLTGPWQLHADWGPSFKYDLVCGFTQTGQAVSGPCMGGIPPEKAWGRLDGNKLELEYITIYQGNDVDTHFHGTIDANGGVTGTVDAPFTQGQFEGVQIGDKGPVTSWKLHVVIGGFDFQMLCAMKVKGRLLSGPCGAGDGIILTTTGTVDANGGVTFAYDDARAATPVHVVYTGTVQSDGSLKGTTSNGAQSGTFNAHRK
jgi:hypothetical protein